MADWNKLLQALGFTESESAVYLASLELGPSPVQAIAKKAKVSRVTTYAVIQKLSRGGLMSSVTKGKKQYFAAESPERLTTYVHGNIDSMQATLRDLQGSLDELKLLQAGDRPTVKYFEGVQGIRALMEDLLTTPTEQIYEIANRNEILKALPANALNKFRSELDKRKIKFMAVYVSDSFVPRKYAEVKIIPPAKDSFTGGIIVFGTKIALTTYTKKIEGIVIDSPELAATFVAVFLRVWRSIPVPARKGK
ncbi:MAG: helix-turn-helix domain-containing protein [Candidatus Andersenbacteria bacterium]